MDMDSSHLSTYADVEDLCIYYDQYTYTYIYIIYIYTHNGINVHISCFLGVKSQPGGPSTSAGRAARPRFGFALEVGSDGL
jgi:hypothetical protein